jgi:hypothetical protein
MKHPDLPPQPADIGHSDDGAARREFLSSVAATVGVGMLAACSATPEIPGAATPATVGPVLRRITPPRLDEARLGKRILCHRPMRRGSPRLSVGVEGDTLVAHNYGHGGSGWTLAPGCAQYVVDLAEASPRGASMTKGTPVTVVGGGVIGLFTAYELARRGYSNITVMAARFDDLTSHNAGGLLAPVSMDNEPALQEIIDKIGINAYRFFAAVAKGTGKDIRRGALMMPSYFENREESGLEPYVGQVMQPAKDVVLDFGNGTTRRMVAYDDGIFLDTAMLMEELTAYLKPRVRFVTREVTDLTALGTSVVYNCTGLGAGKLSRDQAMVSVQGHLVMLKNQVPADLQSMILVYFGDGETSSGQKVKRSFYIMPKRLPGNAPNDIGVVGGTFIEGATLATPNADEFIVMMNAARRFYGLETPASAAG